MLLKGQKKDKNFLSIENSNLLGDKKNVISVVSDSKAVNFNLDMQLCLCVAIVKPQKILSF